MNIVDAVIFGIEIQGLLNIIINENLSCVVHHGFAYRRHLAEKTFRASPGAPCSDGDDEQYLRDMNA